eukprot:CAMPEP_0119057228 /NCGR_PEP_ID=MMETSP1178-20130426/1740_1 /TAXON_ID=33656 /ORGANISM="unid sp, Strain CCMP2000" /LENGTH=162 /DNA_ID=CAMNT_0007038039 /DNA_START=537 /DNA_END=1025 /DNA_ORIENTATION=+
MCENPVQDPKELKARLKALRLIVAAKQSEGSEYLQMLMKLTSDREKNDATLAQVNPDLYAEIQQLVEQENELESQVNLLESGTTKRLSAVGRMRAAEERRRQLIADGITPEGEPVDPALAKNSFFVFGFRLLFVLIILGGVNILLSLVDAGQMAKDVAGVTQ